jgi:uncharacterized protein
MVAAAFWSLAIAAACLWLPRGITSRLPRRLWVVPTLLAALVALAGRMIDGTGLLVLAALAAAAHLANHATRPPVRGAAHLLVWVVCAGLFLHVLPGFSNPLLLDHVVLGPGAEPYTQYLNVDKGIAGLLLLGIYVPDRVEQDQGVPRAAGGLWRFVVVVAGVMALALAVGYVRWDPKLPSFWPMWTGIMLVLTALPEEAAFRGVIHTSLARWRGDPRSIFAIVAGGVAFGLAHAAGGPMHVLVAAAAGIGYGWIYASTGSIGAAILAHAALNAIHFLFFTYPAVAS